MAFYLAHGGFFGWMNGKRPDFAEQPIRAIRNSNGRLYQEIRQELNQN